MGKWTHKGGEGAQCLNICSIIYSIIFSYRKHPERGVPYLGSIFVLFSVCFYK